MSEPASDNEDDTAEPLPALDGEPDDPEGAVGDEGLEDFLQGLDDETTVDLDDEAASDLDVGIDLHRPLDAGDDSETADGLDIGELLSPADENVSYAEDEEGPAHFDVSAGIAAFPEVDADDAAEGALEDVGYLVSDELPSLGSNDDGDSTEQETWELHTADQEDERPAWSDPPWSEQRPTGHAWRACVALAVDANRIVAGGAELYLLARDQEAVAHLAHEAGRIHSLALVGAERQTLLCATVVGQLARYAPLGAAPRMCTSWRQAAGLRAADPAALDLCSVPHRPETVLGRTSTGCLLRSPDEGLSWERIDLGGACLALSTGGAPVLALARGRSGPRLYRSIDGGMSWTAMELRGEAARSARGKSPQLAAQHDVLALSARNRRTVVSRDAGASFNRVVGCSGTTCLAVGQGGSTPMVWAATYRELEDASDVCAIDPAEGVARRIATMQGFSEPAAPDDEAETARVSSLAWDPTEQTLWAVGGFGLTRYRPSPAP